MLVLTRKLNEEILIGQDIRVRLVRVRGNTVRIGIEAPRDIRIARGELELKEEESADEFTGMDLQPCRREQAFAHQSELPSERAAVKPVNRVTQPQLFVGTVRKSGKDAQLKRAPLAQFVAAS